MTKHSLHTLIYLLAYTLVISCIALHLCIIATHCHHSNVRTHTISKAHNPEKLCQVYCPIGFHTDITSASKGHYIYCYDRTKLVQIPPPKSPPNQLLKLAKIEVGACSTSEASPKHTHAARQRQQRAGKPKAVSNYLAQDKPTSHQHIQTRKQLLAKRRHAARRHPNLNTHPKEKQRTWLHTDTLNRSTKVQTCATTRQMHTPAQTTNKQKEAPPAKAINTRRPRWRFSDAANNCSHLQHH